LAAVWLFCLLGLLISIAAVTQLPTPDIEWVIGHLE
jgi:hypothetical protein